MPTPLETFEAFCDAAQGQAVYSGPVHADHILFAKTVARIWNMLATDCETLMGVPNQREGILPQLDRSRVEAHIAPEERSAAFVKRTEDCEKIAHDCRRIFKGAYSPETVRKPDQAWFACLRATRRARGVQIAWEQLAEELSGRDAPRVEH